ncbi:hypothetical protein KEM55_007750 [Ascosphaera atra]|nr:hypothetical protein KEM55_007750 [Ascosphaera atra]
MGNPGCSDPTRGGVITSHPFVRSMTAEKLQTVMSGLLECARAWAKAESLGKKQEEEERKQKELAEEQEKRLRQKEEQERIALTRDVAKVRA